MAQKVTEGNVYALQNKFTSTPLPSLPKFKNDDATTEFLTWDELERLTKLDLSADKYLENVRNVFLFLDNDKAGQTATDELSKNKIICRLKEKAEKKCLPLCLFS